MNHEIEKKGIDDKGESLVKVLRSCPKDEEIWKIILDRSNDPPRDFSFEDVVLEDQTVENPADPNRLDG